MFKNVPECQQSKELMTCHLSVNTHCPDQVYSLYAVLEISGAPYPCIRMFPLYSYCNDYCYYRLQFLVFEINHLLPLEKGRVQMSFSWSLYFFS